MNDAIVVTTPDAGSAARLKRPAKMAFTGEMIDADEALSLGLVSQVVPHQKLMATAVELALPASCARVRPLHTRAFTQNQKCHEYHHSCVD